MGDEPDDDAEAGAFHGLVVAGPDYLPDARSCELVAIDEGPAAVICEPLGRARVRAMIGCWQTRICVTWAWLRAVAVGTSIKPTIPMRATFSCQRGRAERIRLTSFIRV
jgi:hypothetical protein